MSESTHEGSCEPLGTKPAKVPVVWFDEDVADAAAMLREEHELTEFAGPEAMLDGIERGGTPQVLLIGDDREACRALRRARGLLDLPILMVVRAREDLAGAFEAGASDAVVGPCEACELAARIGGLVRWAQHHAAGAREVALLADTLPHLVWKTGEDGACDYANRRSVEYFGAGARRPAEVIHPDDLQAAEEGWLHSLRTGLDYDAVMRMRRHDGVYRYHQVRARALRDPEGRPRCWYGTSTDVEEQKRSELELAALLEASQRERHSALEANQIKDEFLGVVSHELRTPLTAILGWACMLRDAALPEAKRGRAIEAIERNARVQTRLIEDLLDVSRIVSGKLEIEMTSVEPELFVRAAVDAVRLAARAKGVHLDETLDAELGHVLGDELRLRQIVGHLLSNAVKFTPAGGSILVTAERVGRLLQIAVKDSGQGIAPRFLPQVFDRFRQADGSSTRAHGGLGVGLSIVRHLVELHGGSIEAHSAGEGKGATFVVRLPLLGARGERLQPHRGVKAPLPDLAGVRVLVVDDDADMRTLVGSALDLCHAEVETASSAAQALACFERTPPHVLVSDIGMPEQDGLTLIRKVRARPAERGGRVPSVALTAYAEDRVGALRAGFDLHVAKPIEPAQLLAVVGRLAART